MFKQWFANLRNPDVVLNMDNATVDADKSFPLHTPMNEDGEKIKLKYDIGNLEFRIKMLRRALADIAVEKKSVNFYEFDMQLQQLLKAQEAVAHQNMVASKNPNVTEILYKALREERAKTMFLVFGELNITPEEAEAKYAEYLKGDGQDK